MARRVEKFEEQIFKVGATSPIMLIKVGEGGNGFANDPTGATVLFSMVLRSEPTGTPKVNDASAVIQNIKENVDGTWYAELYYNWQSANVDTAKEYNGDFKVTKGVVIIVPKGEIIDGQVVNKYIPITFVTSVS